MNMIQQLVTPNQMVPSLNDDVESRFNEPNDSSPMPIGLSFGQQPTLGQNFATGAVIQPAGVAINPTTGNKVRFNQNRPWQKSSGSLAQAFASEDLDAE